MAATQILVTSSPPSYSSGVETKAQVRTAQFGDGYRQRSATLNNVSSNATFVWEVMPSADADALLATFEAMRGVDAFFYNIPGETVARKWSCAEWSFTWDGPATKRVTAKFMQEFDPG